MNQQTHSTSKRSRSSYCSPSFMAATLLSTCLLTFLCFVPAYAQTGLSTFEESTLSRKQAEEKILLLASQELNCKAEQLVVGEISERNFELTQESSLRAKVIHKESQQVIEICLDKDGHQADYISLRDAELMAKKAQYGKLDPRLSAKLDELKAGESIRVAIWLKYGELKLPKREDYLSKNRKASPSATDLESNPTQLSPQLDSNGEKQTSETQEQELEDPFAEERLANKALRAKAAEMLRAQMKDVQAPILSLLNEMGLTPLTVSSIAPILYVVVTPEQIAQIELLDSVDTIYGPNENKSEQDIAFDTVKADIVSSWGHRGTGVDVGVLEDGRIEFSNPNLSTGITRDSGSFVTGHSTAVGGIIASTSGSVPGVARQTSLYSANATSYNDNDLSDAMDWASGTENLDVINNSWGGNSGSTSLNEHDRHLDYIVRNLWSTCVKSAGNQAGTCNSGTGNVTSPGKGWNMITVGAINDQNTVTWSDDNMYSCSSFVDPATGCDKPEVSAPGQGFTGLTTSSPWTGSVGSGTSYAAPMVSGLAANIMSADSYFEIRPEATKAAIIAGALHNVEGASRLSDIDGAGCVDMRSIVHLATNGTFQWNSRTSTSFPYEIDVDLVAGQRVRAAIAWDSNANSTYTTDELDADLDFRVRDSAGTLIASSASFNNAYEVLDFEPTADGTYTFEVSSYRFDGTTEYVGFACWKGNRALDPNLAQTHPEPPLERDTYAQGTSSFWQFSAIRMLDTGDYDIRLYGSDLYEDPEDLVALETSAYGGQNMDFVGIDGNHTSSLDYHTEVNKFSGAGDYSIEKVTRTGDIVNGDYGPYTMDPDKLAMTFDARFIAGDEKTIRIVPTFGADLEVFLMQSDPLDPDSFTTKRSSSVTNSNSGVAGEEESVTFTSAESDWLGLIILNIESTAGSTFMIYSDDEAPTGSISINNGQAQSGSHQVMLNLDSVATASGLADMRIRNAGDPWAGWEAISTERIWALAPGTGNKTVEYQVRNNAGIQSPIYSDSIQVWPCPQPIGPLANGNFSAADGFPWCFTNESVTSLVRFNGTQAQVTGSNLLNGIATQDFMLQRFTAASDAEVSFSWEYDTIDAAGFDFAFYDIIDLSTGSSVVAGPVQLTTMASDSGVVLQSFSGSGEYELHLGTASTDNYGGAGVSTFDDVVITDLVLGVQFIRGDCNGDGGMNIIDAVFGLGALFSGGPNPPCADSCDGNDDGSVNIVDMVFILARLFQGGVAPQAPFPNCGIDPTADALPCPSNPTCP